MEIAYKNFPVFTIAEKDALNKTVSKVNEWVKENKIKIINIETGYRISGGGVTSIDKEIDNLCVWYFN